MIFTQQLGQKERPYGWEDLIVLGGLFAAIYGIVMLAREWTGALRPVAEIHSEIQYLPLYAFYSLSRGVIAYGVSFLFTMFYGYVMARVRDAERIMLPVLDILQSIPVLGFLPGFVLGLVHLFPHWNIGLEIASVLMIFTGQVWNMTFSFYSSLKSVPPDLLAVSQLAKMSWWQRFLRVDLSYAATGLVWNSMMSMAGGWFFLTVSEAFVLGEHDFRLPGLGSYMSVAIEQGDTKAQILGVVAMLSMIVIVDQLVWRPIVAWSQKFTEEENSAAARSWLWERIRRSRVWGLISQSAGQIWRSPTQTAPRKSILAPRGLPGPWGRRAMTLLLGLGVLWGVSKYVHTLTTLHSHDWIDLVISTLTTFLRVMIAVALASLWTIPIGVLIGRNPQAARACQPIIQMAASFPAPMIFPAVVGGMLALGIGLNVSSVLLLLLGTQWYVLFNVIAGASALPRDLWEFSRLARFSLTHRWRTLILPGIFPHLLTGWITATGGAWNASIVAEYMKYRGQTLSTVGLGSSISIATEKGDFHILAAAVGIMALTVVSFNRFVWRPLSHRAQTRYALQ
jgi:NitT/TauT family transport system permease protein